MPDNTIARRAFEARTELGLSTLEPIPDIASFLRMTQGISVARIPIEGDISGLFARAGKWSVIVVNSRRSLGQQNYTVAHEYYHIKFERDLEGSVCVTETASPLPGNEQRAEDFAAEFLMPAPAVSYILSRRAPCGTIQMPDVVEMGQHFRVSHAAMLRRLYELGYITKSQRTHMQSGVTEVARRLGFDAALYKPSDNEMILSPIARMADEALKLGKITGGRYSEILLESRLADVLYGEEAEQLDEASRPKPPGGI